jgi:hypothetical protein
MPSIAREQEVIAELSAASDKLDHAGDDLFLDEIGGELGFDRSRRALCAGASFVALGDGDRAEIEASAAINLFGQLPTQVRWGAGELGAWVDLGAARVLRGDLAGAQDALGRVFNLAPDRRTEALARRLINLGRLLGASRYRGALEARQMSEAIEDFAGGGTARAISRCVIGPARPEPRRTGCPGLTTPKRGNVPTAG